MRVFDLKWVSKDGEWQSMATIERYGVVGVMGLLCAGMGVFLTVFPVVVSAPSLVVGGTLTLKHLRKKGFSRLLR